MIEYAFTTKLPLAVMIVAGIKKWENRSMMPVQAKGRGGLTCSKSSSAREYAGFLAWSKTVFPKELCEMLPPWELVSSWRGQLIAVCNYEASYTAPNPPIWNEDYPVWWHLSDVTLLEDPIPCRGNVGMWKLPEEICQKIN